MPWHGLHVQPSLLPYPSSAVSGQSQFTFLQKYPWKGAKEKEIGKMKGKGKEEKRTNTKDSLRNISGKVPQDPTSFVFRAGNISLCG